MSNISTNLSEYEAIAKTVQHYIDGAKAGRGAEMKPAFHQDATIFGYADGELFAGPIQLLFGKVDHDAPATEGLHARIVGIDSSTRLLGSGWNSMTGTATATLTCSRSSKSMERGRL
jgi:Putative lumazine-binding